MSVNIEMPKLSDTMTEGTLVKWHKKVGDSVEIGDILAEVETDKATMEMEAFDEGTITEILIQEGDKAVIGGVLAVLDGEEGGSSSDSAPAKDAEAARPHPLVRPRQQRRRKRVPNRTPRRNPLPPLRLPPMATVSKPLLSPKKSPMKRASISPAFPAQARRGRIVKADVEGASSGKSAPKSSQASAAAGLSAAAKSRSSAPAPAPAQAIQPVAKEGDERIELSSMRKVIASRLLTSKTTIPHFYLHVEVDAAPLMALRKQVNDQAEKTHGNKYSVNDFILKAAINAAEAVPAINASFAGDHIVKFKHVGLSVAIAVEDGLVTPVITEAESKSLLAISRAVKDFATRAKDKKLKPNEFDGGTITVSNLGAWGIDSFDAIVNPPQAAILSVGAAVEKPVVVNGEIKVGLRMNIGLSADHRVVDGAVGASYISEVKKLIENPALMLL